MSAQHSRHESLFSFLAFLIINLTHPLICQELVLRRPSIQYKSSLRWIRVSVKRNKTLSMVNCPRTTYWRRKYIIVNKNITADMVTIVVLCVDGICRLWIYYILWLGILLRDVKVTQQQCFHCVCCHLTKVFKLK